MDAHPFHSKLDSTWIIQIKLWLEDIESGKKTPDDVRKDLLSLTGEPKKEFREEEKGSVGSQL